MKRKKLLIPVGILSVAAVAVVVVLLVFSGKAPEPLAVLTKADGSVSVMKAGVTDWTAGETGQTLDKGDTIRVNSDAAAQVTFFEGTTVDLAAGTTLEISELAAGATGTNTIELKQQIGNTISRVTKLADPASRYEIETPAGVAAVRGTVMEISVDPKGTTSIYNRQGSIVASAQGVQVLIPEGSHSVILSGEPPSQPLTSGGRSEGNINIVRSVLKAEGVSTTYIYEVTNRGGTPQSNVFVGDEEVSSVTYVGGDVNGNGLLDPGETWIYTGSTSG
jgi:hypothetical protein